MSITSTAQLVFQTSDCPKYVRALMTRTQFVPLTRWRFDCHYLTYSTSLTEIWNLVHDISLCLFDSIYAGKAGLHCVSLCLVVCVRFVLCFNFIIAYLNAANSSADKSVADKIVRTIGSCYSIFVWHFWWAQAAVLLWRCLVVASIVNSVAWLTRWSTTDHLTD